MSIYKSLYSRRAETVYPVQYFIWRPSAEGIPNIRRLSHISRMVGVCVERIFVRVYVNYICIFACVYVRVYIYVYTYAYRRVGNAKKKNVGGLLCFFFLLPVFDDNKRAPAKTRHTQYRTGTRSICTRCAAAADLKCTYYYCTYCVPTYKRRKSGRLLRVFCTRPTDAISIYLLIMLRVYIIICRTYIIKVSQ